MAKQDTWGFPKNEGYHFGGPKNKDYSILGSLLGSPYSGKLPHEYFATACWNTTHALPLTANVSISAIVRISCSGAGGLLNTSGRDSQPVVQVACRNLMETLCSQGKCKQWPL